MAIATLFLYWEIQYHDFVSFDDPLYVVENPNVKKGFSLKSILWSFSFFTTGPNWIPLSWLSHILDYQLYGLNPRGHHLNNLLLHLANTILLFLVLSRMTKTVWRSAFVSALFAVHPLHVESVAWVSERKDVLSTLFLMLTLWSYARYVELASMKRYLAVLFFFVLGLMAKSMLVSLPFVLILLDYWPLGRFGFYGKSREQICTLLILIKEKVPLFVLSFAMSLLTFFSQKGAGAVYSFDVFPLPLRISNALLAYMKYIEKTFYPNKLAVFYPYLGKLIWWQVLGAFVLLVCITCFALRNIKTLPWLTVGWLWYLGMLFPVIGIVQVGLQSMADRYTYVSIIGIFIIASWGLYSLSRRFRYGKIIFVIVGFTLFISLSIFSWYQIQYWRNDQTLFRHALNVTTGNHVAHNNLGLALFREGKLEEAASHFSMALKIRPQSLDYRSNMGAVLAKQGKFEEAVPYLVWVTDRMPSYSGANYNLGLLYFNQGRFEKAIECFKRIVKFEPDFAKAYFQLGRIMTLQGRYDDALSHFSKALHIDPQYQEARLNIEIVSGKITAHDEDNKNFNSKME